MRGRAARRLAAWVMLLSTLGALAAPKEPIFLPVHVRPGLTRARGLLRNGTLPVMGAVVQGWVPRARL
jgi:hypothetical protein